MAKKPETVFSERVAKDLKKLPRCWFVKIQQVAKRGIPDYLLCISGRFIALELKVNGGEPDPLQRWTLERIADADGIALVANPANWPNTLTLLKELACPEEEELDEEEELTAPVGVESEKPKGKRH